MKYPVNTKTRLTKKQQLWILENHPYFTNKCNNCGYDYGENKDIEISSTHWNCPKCGLIYFVGNK